MKKIVIIGVVLALALAIPFSIKAFSVSGIWDKIFKDVNPAVEGVEYEALDEEFADEKYTVWLDAYEAKDLFSLMNTHSNLYFTNAEINYIFKKKLAEMKNPACDSFELWFKDDYAYLKAHMLKYLPGNVSGEIVFEQKNRRIKLAMRKVRWAKVPIPAFVANAILERELYRLINFLHSDPDFPYVETELSEDYFEIKFKRE